MRFGFVRDSYNRLLGSTSGQRKIRVFMYLLPAAVSFGVATQNYLQVSFGIYLKYQALVDSYYIQKNDTNNLTLIEDS